jgi:hypothetical protein
VGLITWVASLMLGLPYATPVYVTLAKKNLKHILDHLCILARQLAIFDDRANSHAQKLNKTPRGAARMIQTGPYSTLQMSREVALRLHSNLETYFPITEDFATKHPALHKDASTEIEGEWPVYNLALTN